MHLSTPLHNFKLPISTISPQMSTNISIKHRIYSYSSPPPVKTPATSPPSSLPVRTIPGGYGLPVLGPLADRLDYAWFQGAETFFKKRIERYQSTVYRTNVPPSFPFFVVNPNVIAVLDCKSFAYMFDMDLVEKRNVLVGDWMPSTKFTGDRRVCAYLDPTEPQHEQVRMYDSVFDNLERILLRIYELRLLLGYGGYSCGWECEWLCHVDDHLEKVLEEMHYGYERVSG